AVVGCADREHVAAAGVAVVAGVVARVAAVAGGDKKHHAAPATAAGGGGAQGRQRAGVRRGDGFAIVVRAPTVARDVHDVRAPAEGRRLLHVRRGVAVLALAEQPHADEARLRRRARHADAIVAARGDEAGANRAVVRGGGRSRVVVVV